MIRRKSSHAILIVCTACILVTAIAVLLGTPRIAEARPQVLQPQKPSGPPLYTIQPNDILEIYFWKQTDMTRRVTVRPDGRISLPLVQDLQAAGLNPGELKTKIEEGLKDYYEVVPNVTVLVDQIRSYRVFVTGRVAMQGAIQVEKPISVLQAIALAGGFTDYAKKADIIIVRGSGDDSDRFKFDYEQFIKGGNDSQNMYLKNGDVVVIP